MDLHAIKVACSTPDGNSLHLSVCPCVPNGKSCTVADAVAGHRHSAAWLATFLSHMIHMHTDWISGAEAKRQPAFA